MQTNLFSLLSSSVSDHYREGCKLIQSATADDLCLLVNQAISQNQPALIDSISYQALDLYPDHPSLLSTGANISAMNCRWVESAERLIRLVRILGKAAPLDAFILLSRVQRCAGNIEQAKYALNVGLLVYPAAEPLVTMLAELAPTADSTAPEAEIPPLESATA